MEEAGNYGIDICDRQGYILIKVDATDPKKICFTNSLYLQLIFTDSQDVSEDVKASVYQSGLTDSVTQSISVFDINGSSRTSVSAIDSGSVCDAVQDTKTHLADLVNSQAGENFWRTKCQSTQTMPTDLSVLNSDSHKGRQHRKQRVTVTEQKALSKQHTEPVKNICLKCHASFKTASALRNHSKSPCIRKTLAVVLSRIDSHLSQLTKNQVLEAKSPHVKEEEILATELDDSCVDNDIEDPQTDSETKEEHFCKYCEKTFRSVDSYREHTLTSGEAFHNCEICNSRHNTKASLMVHQYINHPGVITDITNERLAVSQAGGLGDVTGGPQGEGKLGCFLCETVFCSVRNLQDHMRIHTGELKFKCCICDRKFSRISELTRHCDEVHLGINLKYQTFRCHQCNVTFSSMEALRKHQINHPLTCNFCGEEQETSKERAAHLASKHSDQAPQCTQCKQFFNTVNALKCHKVKFHKDRKQCTICGALVRRYGLQAHMDSYHREKHLFCDQCPMTFSRQRALKIHLRIHTGEKPFKCKVCGEQFRSSSSLYLHKAVHTEEKPLQCEICGKSCSYNYQLKAHMRLHSVKVYSCQVCGKGFKSKYTFQKHSQSKHADGSQEVIYICQVCEQSFKFKAMLQRHMKSKHSDESQVIAYSCQICKKGFKYKGRLQRHMRSKHADESQDSTYNCQICGQGFAYMCGLRKHMRLKHADQSQNSSRTLEPIYKRQDYNENPVKS